MKFVRQGSCNCISVYSKDDSREKYHLGNIAKLPTLGWGFYACGKEQFLLPQELEEILEKIKEVSTE